MLNENPYTRGAKADVKVKKTNGRRHRCKSLKEIFLYLASTCFLHCCVFLVWKGLKRLYGFPWLGIFGAILFGISLITMFANIGLDIYLKYKGCCGIYSSICRDQKTFKRMRADLEKKSKIVDGKYAAGKFKKRKRFCSWTTSHITMKF